MTLSVETFEASVQRLVGNFGTDHDHYVSKHYVEAQARVDFITPFFEALGWDVRNTAGLRHEAREVIVEKGESDMTGRPDYSFRLGGQTKFFVEAKAPSESLDDPRHIIQAKTYAWNTKSVFFVILTNFEEFRFYDASLKPDERKPDEGLLFKINYTQYLDQFQKLAEFSRERVAAGSLNAMLPRDRRTERLRIPVDEAFLDEMTGWREELARDIYKNNHGLTARQLNEVVQRLLDRIVFIRIAEDRRVIERYQLRAAAEEWRARGGKFPIFDWLRPLFEKVNEDFNGEIFKPNELLERTQVDSEILARIIERLYPPRSPYRFDVIGVELLGSIYERYLGNTIRTTARQVRVEEKPEVRKAGGVYYTPQYIVDYIVKNTVGKLIEGKTPRQIEKIRILDPACGSGSFLIGAFQCLIDYHIRWFLEHPEQEVRHAHPSLDFMREVQASPDGNAWLSVYRKAKILRNNLFGVDIDPQAVEITMMSLYLKALEGEKSQLPPKQSLLPELKYNIICGNSLIGPDVYNQGTFFGDAERDRINAFDWYSASPHVILSASEESRHFEMRETLRSAQGDKPGRSRSGATAPSIGQVMRDGGFDCVIGNPPYVRIQHMKEWAPFEVEHYKERYKAASSGNYDIYVVFVEKGLSVLRKGGRLGYILPHKFFNAKYGEPLRGLIAEGKHLSEIIHFGDQQVFEGATNYTCLLFLRKDGEDKFQFSKVDDLQAWRNDGEAVTGIIPATRATTSEWNFAVGKVATLTEKLAKVPVKLGDVAHIFVGTQTSADEVFVLGHCRRKGANIIGRSKALGKLAEVEAACTVPFLRGREIRRYVPPVSSCSLICPYHIGTESCDLITEREMRKEFPRAWAYLEANKQSLAAREGGRFRGPGWHAFGYPKSMHLFGEPKIIVPDYNSVASFTYDTGGHFYKTGYGVLPRDNRIGSAYLLGLLNSRLLFWYLKRIGTFLRGGYIRFWTQYIDQLPIRTTNFFDLSDKARHDKIVELVERMLGLNKQKHSGTLAPSEIDRIEREIASTDAEIDGLVYELYGITEEERKIVEGAL